MAPTITGNKARRQMLNVRYKKESGKTKREDRLRRRKEESKDPTLRTERLAQSKTKTLDQKRAWDQDVDEESLYASVDVAQVKRRRMEEGEQNGTVEPESLFEEEPLGDEDEDEEDAAPGEDDDIDSMLGSEVDEEDDDAGEEGSEAGVEPPDPSRVERDSSLAPSATSTNFDITPAALYAKFPVLFSDEPPAVPKLLVTTSLNATIHKEAEIFCSLLPNSEYIRRSAHRYGHKYSVREICRFAANREFTAVLVLNEDQKKIDRLTVVHLPSGPTLTYTVNNWITGSKLPGHGKAQDFYPELLLNNFKSTLGLLAAKSWQTLFPPAPEIVARQVVTLHNQRDYIFLRRHRYIFRDKRDTERSVADIEGKDMRGVEGLRVGLQELGPRCTFKLRRVDKGIGRAGSHGEDALSWEWKSKMEKTRTRFSL